MVILMKTTSSPANLLQILFLALSLSISLVRCQSEKQAAIKVLGQVYFSLPQIFDQDYSVVPEIEFESLPLIQDPVRPNQPPTRKAPPSPRFTAKQKVDYFVTQAADKNHQTTRYNFIKGKNIFTPAYIQSQVLEESQIDLKIQKDFILSNLQQEQLNKSFEQLKEKLNGVQEDMQAASKAEQITDQQTNKPQTNTGSNSQPTQLSAAVDAKASQIYNQFKGLEALKGNNLRQNINSKAEVERSQNLEKLIGYIIVGLIIAFAILKRFSKSKQTSIPKTNQQRAQLRLKDSADDQEQDSDESDDSN